MERGRRSVVKTPNISAIREMRAFCLPVSQSLYKDGRRAARERMLFVFSKDDKKTTTMVACGVTDGCRWLAISTSAVSSRYIQFVDIIKCTFKLEEEEEEEVD